MKPLPFLSLSAPGPSQRAALEAAVLLGEQVTPVRPTPDARPAWTILVADDDADTRRYVGRCLENAGLSRPVRVVDAADGTAALRCLQAARFDLVVADVHMPGLDGAGLAAALTADAVLAHLPVLFISGDPEAGGALAGALHRFLPKPFNRQRLLEHVRALLDAAPTA